MIRFAVLLCLACAPYTTQVPSSDGRYAMGTVFEIEVRSDAPVNLDPFYRRVAELESVFSSFDQKSDLSRFNAHAGAGPQSVRNELGQLLHDSIRYAVLTDGAFDPTVAPLFDRSTNDGVPPYVGIQNLEVSDDLGRASLRDPRSRVDFGGIAKGVALDEVARMLKAQGIPNALLSFGQSSLHAMGKPNAGAGWRLLLRNTRGGFVGHVTLSGQALSVSDSAGIIDPRSGEKIGVNRIAAVVSETGALAEALSTALVVLGPRAGLALIETIPDVEALIIQDDGVRGSSRWAQVAHFRAQK